MKEKRVEHNSKKSCDAGYSTQLRLSLRPKNTRWDDEHRVLVNLDIFCFLIMLNAHGRGVRGQGQRRQNPSSNPW